MTAAIVAFWIGGAVGWFVCAALRGPAVIDEPCEHDPCEHGPCDREPERTDYD